MQKFAVNYKTKEIIVYNIFSNGDTDFPRGTWLVDNESIITGIESKNKAEQFLKENPYKL